MGNTTRGSALALALLCLQCTSPSPRMPPSPPTPLPDLKWGSPPGGALDKFVVGVSGGSSSGRTATTEVPQSLKVDSPAAPLSKSVSKLRLQLGKLLTVSQSASSLPSPGAPDTRRSSLSLRASSDRMTRKQLHIVRFPTNSALQVPTCNLDLWQQYLSRQGIENLPRRAEKEAEGGWRRWQWRQWRWQQ